MGTPNSKAVAGDYDYYRIVDAGEGYIEIEKNNEHLLALTLPYPSEKRLNEMISESLEEEEQQKNYSQKIGSILENLSSKFREDTINIVVGHFYVAGGEVSDSERPVQLGGSYVVEADVFPQKAQYIALGHLHRPQR